MEEKLRKKGSVVILRLIISYKKGKRSNVDEVRRRNYESITEEWFSGEEEFGGDKGWFLEDRWEVEDQGKEAAKELESYDWGRDR